MRGSYPRDAATKKPTTRWYIMMTSSNGNIFRVAGPLCGEFICHQGQWRGALVFSLISAAEQTKQSRRRWFETPPLSLWRHYNDSPVELFDLYTHNTLKSKSQLQCLSVSRMPISKVSNYWSRLNIKTVFPGMGIPIIKIRQSWDQMKASAEDFSILMYWSKYWYILFV